MIISSIPAHLMHISLHTENLVNTILQKERGKDKGGSGLPCCDSKRAPECLRQFDDGGGASGRRRALKSNSSASARLLMVQIMVDSVYSGLPYKRHLFAFSTCTCFPYSQHS
jgi:hypothetical protein